MLKVVHWNLHHGGVGSDGKFDIAPITDWLIKFAPDVVSLNELEENNGYGHLDQIEHHRAALQVAQGVPWYATFVTYTGGTPLAGGGSGLLTKEPHANPIRKNLGGNRPGLTILQPVHRSLVATCHPDPNSAVKRCGELTQYILLIDRQIQAPSDTTHSILRQIICGDFNTTPTSIEIAAFPTLYKDAWVEAKKIGKATSFTVDGATKSHRIDYVWYKGLTIAACDVPDTHINGRLPSDHHPVVVTFE